MQGWDIDAVMKVEDGTIERLIEISKFPPDDSRSEGLLFCANCGKAKSVVESTTEKDLKRWVIGPSEEHKSSFRPRSRCNCTNGIEGRRKQEVKPKKKSNTDFLRNEQSNSKDFIAHNIRTCNSNRLKDNYASQMVSHFIHHKDSKDYMREYRSGKLEKLEYSSYQLDQSLSNEEVYRSLSKSLSTLMKSVDLLDGQPIPTPTDTVKVSKSDPTIKESKLRTIQNSSIYNDLDHEIKKNPNLKDIDVCMKCGDHLKEQDFFSMRSGVPLDSKYPLRTNIHEKMEEKKVKKLLKRTSDHRPRLIIEKPISAAIRPDIDQLFTSDLQPFCQQMPIQKNSLIEKRSTFKKDEWRGHPSSTKPRFSDGLRRMPDGSSSRGDSGNTQKTLDRADFFGCYGEKYQLLKEST